MMFGLLMMKYSFTDTYGNNIDIELFKSGIKIWAPSSLNWYYRYRIDDGRIQWEQAQSSTFPSEEVKQFCECLVKLPAFS